MTNLFHHDGFLDVVPSDVVAGLLLLRLEQRSKGLDVLVPSRAHSRKLLPSSEEDVEILANFQYYGPYFIAVYSSPLMSFTKPLSQSCRLARECACFKPNRAEGDDCCLSHQVYSKAAVFITFSIVSIYIHIKESLDF